MISGLTTGSQERDHSTPTNCRRANRELSRAIVSASDPTLRQMRTEKKRLREDYAEPLKLYAVDWRVDTAEPRSTKTLLRA